MYIEVGFLILTGFFIYLDGFGIVNNQVKYQIQRAKQLKSLVKSRHTGFCKITYVMTKIVAQSLLYTFVQKVNKSVVKLDKNKYKVSFIINHRIHTIVIEAKKGPDSLIGAYDENDNDITFKLVPYFRNIKIQKNLTPSFFNCDKISIETGYGESFEFNNDSSIEI